MQKLSKTALVALALYVVSAGMASAAPGLLVSDRSATARDGLLISDRSGIIVTGRDGLLVSD